MFFLQLYSRELHNSLHSLHPSQPRHHLLNYRFFPGFPFYTRVCHINDSLQHSFWFSPCMSRFTAAKLSFHMHRKLVWSSHWFTEQTALCHETPNTEKDTVSFTLEPITMLVLGSHSLRESHGWCWQVKPRGWLLSQSRYQGGSRCCFSGGRVMCTRHCRGCCVHG